MRFPAFFLFPLLVFPALAGGQQQKAAKSSSPDPAGATDTAPIPDFPRPLAIKSTVTTALSGALLNRSACDEDGNIYLRPYVSQRVSGLPSSTSPVQRMKPDGSLGEVFQNTDAEGKKLVTEGVAVSADGKVYQAGLSDKPDYAVYVTEFAKDGSVKSRTRLQTDYFIAYQLAVFKSGEFLVSGTKGKDGHTPFTAVFSSDGKLLKEVTEPEDADLAKKAEAGDRSFDSLQTSESGNSAVSYGDAASGSDGNVYLMRGTSPAQIYVVSPHGEVVRKLRIDPGQSGFVAHTIRASKEGLAIAFGIRWEKSDLIIKAVTYSGDPLGTYVLKDHYLSPTQFACYSGASFTFLATTTENKVLLHTVEAR